MDKHVLLLGTQMGHAGHGEAKVTERSREGGKTAPHGQGDGAVFRRRETNCEGLTARRGCSSQGTASTLLSGHM